MKHCWIDPWTLLWVLCYTQFKSIEFKFQKFSFLNEIILYWKGWSTGITREQRQNQFGSLLTTPVLVAAIRLGWVRPANSPSDMSDFSTFYPAHTYQFSRQWYDHPKYYNNNIHVLGWIEIEAKLNYFSIRYTTSRKETKE